MREQGLRARPPRRRRHTTRPGKGRWRVPDLVGRRFGSALDNAVIESWHSRVEFELRRIEGQGQPGGGGVEIPLGAGGERAQSRGAVGGDLLQRAVKLVAVALGEDRGEFSDTWSRV